MNDHQSIDRRLDGLVAEKLVDPDGAQASEGGLDGRASLSEAYRICRATARSDTTRTHEQMGKGEMPDILHRVGIKGASLDDVYKALATIEGLSGWWTSDTRGESRVGAVIQFRFGNGGFDMMVLELEPMKRILWRVTDGPEEWVGTRISFELKENDGWAVVVFKHADWKEPVDFMYHCSTKWAVFLLSLKSLLETGKGAPWPDEIKLDSWEE